MPVARIGRSHDARLLLQQSVRSMASVGALLDEITFEIPLKEALQYTKGKEKWTRADIKLAADGLAAGFLDLGLKPGDTIAAWIPEDDADLHVTQFGAAKAGITLAILDWNISKEGLEKTLLETNARALIYAPYRGHTDLTALLQSVIPELASYDDGLGVPFRSRKFPHLKYLVHTGFDIIQGVENLKHIFLPLEPERSPLPAIQALVSDSTPLFLPVTADGSRGAMLSHADVLSKNAWPVVSGVLSKKLVNVAAAAAGGAH
ncbi:hypothetical protein NSK_002806 [Nannochloropsis salina CCMP1776]|uniref:AMP-dependent synthetase/ligase domain-containing protein n=1 Tax=Nannochloropsis salina CCMP1776 TaxID=1027361 RepID=A0A4D9D3L0_9STRA|nr:hypothetical protein NSK_002806 [Nannochloropsis salina CCMP1776]|eukprot:TFJ85986.1 hypothetical protein NSK_002806 [Nannochloropsis salina CCMP1776]